MLLAFFSSWLQCIHSFLQTFQLFEFFCNDPFHLFHFLFFIIYKNLIFLCVESLSRELLLTNQQRNSQVFLTLWHFSTVFFLLGNFLSFNSSFFASFTYNFLHFFCVQKQNCSLSVAVFLCLWRFCYFVLDKKFLLNFQISKFIWIWIRKISRGLILYIQV
jgi:hypothetical protein